MKKLLWLLPFVLLFAGWRGTDWRAAQTIAGNKTFEDSTTFSDDVVVKYVNNIVYADQYASLQAAINACPSTGGCVFLSPDTYYVAVSCTLKDNVSIMGIGAASVIFNTGKSAAIYYVSTGTSQEKEKNYLANFMIRGTDSSGTGIHFVNVDNPMIEHVWIRNNKGRGMFIYGSAELTILGCHLDSIRSHAIMLQFTHDASISCNVIDRFDSCGILIDTCYDITVCNNKIEYGSAFASPTGGWSSGIRVNGRSTHSNNISVVGNRIFATLGDGNAGIFFNNTLYDVDDTLGLGGAIVGNVIDRTRNGIRLAGNRFTNITGNHLMRISDYPIYLTGSCNTLVSSNYINKTTGTVAFSLDASSDSNFFIGNFVKNVTGMTTNAGDGNIFRDNVNDGIMWETYSFSLWRNSDHQGSATQNAMSDAYWLDAMGGLSFDSLVVDSIFVLGVATEDTNKVDSMHIVCSRARTYFNTVLIADGTDWGTAGYCSYTYVPPSRIVMPTASYCFYKFKPKTESAAGKMRIASIILYGRPK